LEQLEKKIDAITSSKNEDQAGEPKRSSTMNGLRVYTRVIGMQDDRSSQNVFYSRREHGPFYRWNYEEKQARWTGSRMPSPCFSRDFSVTSWKGVPEALKDKLIEHYLE
jgi:hypothetical protein